MGPVENKITVNPHTVSVELTMSNVRPEPLGEPEAEVFVRVEFNYQTSTVGTVSIHMADCGVDTRIHGLKNDLKSLFGDPKYQEWYHRTTKLAEDKTLRHYGIDGRGRHTIKLYVRQTRPEGVGT